jgi:hypothetical protein
MNKIKIDSEKNINEINKNIFKDKQEYDILSKNETNNYLEKNKKLSNEKDEKIQEINNSKELQLLKQDLEKQNNEMMLQMMMQQMMMQQMMQNQINNQWNNQNSSL